MRGISSRPDSVVWQEESPSTVAAKERRRMERIIVFMVLLGVLFGFLRVVRKKVLVIRVLQDRFWLDGCGIWCFGWRNDGFFAYDMHRLSGEGGHPSDNGHRGYGVPRIERQDPPIKAPAESGLIRADFNQAGSAIQTKALYLERLFSSEAIDDVYLYGV